jgi:hypothetical protein
MEQRRPRLGDILDDYCPRERRITNHAVVAMIDDTVRQTRCTTCDAEHEYKEARVPTPRRKRAGGALAESFVDAPRAVRSPEPDAASEPLPPVDLPEYAAAESLEDEIAVAEAASRDEDERPDVDEGPVHRRLIRATLPRHEGQPPEWKEPEFTMRQPTRGQGQRQAQGGWGGGSENRGGAGRNRRPMRAGNAQGAGGQRFGGPRQGNAGNQRHGGQGGQGFGSGQRQNGNRAGGHPGSSRPGDSRGPGRRRGR